LLLFFRPLAATPPAFTNANLSRTENIPEKEKIFCSTCFKIVAADARRLRSAREDLEI
jgi:hypothetical protein